VFVANKRDIPRAMPLKEIKRKLKLPPNVPLIECVATDPKSVAKVLDTLIEMIKIIPSNLTDRRN
jgi:signal recognition particle receptor subunit beta